MDGLGHPPCSLLPESSWESFDARTSGSSCPCHGTTGRIASQAGTGHDDPSATGGASTDRVVGGGRSFQRTDCRKIGSYTTDGAQVASTVVGVAGPAACRGRRGVGLGGTESDLRDPGRRTPVRSSVRHQPRADPRNYPRLRRSRGRAATVQPLDTRRGGPRVCAPRDYREHLHPICGSFFKRRPILDRTACATGCNWTKLTRRRSTQPPSRSATSTGVRRSFTNAAFMSCAATRRRESRLWSEPLRHDLLSLDLSNSKMLTTSATARARSLPTSKLPLVRSSLQASVPLEMSTTSPTTSAALSL